MNMYVLGAASALALTLAGGSAQASVGTPLIAAKATSSTDSSSKTAEKRYCVIDTVTGSRLPRKKCQTRKEWQSEGFDPLASKN